MKVKPTTRPGHVTIELDGRDEALLDQASQGGHRHEIEIRRILVPLDFSAFSERALDMAIPMARQTDASMTFIHVVPIPVPQTDGDLTDYLEVGRAMATGAGGRMDELIRSRGLSGAARAVVREGDPAGQIVDAARELETDLIVMATHGHTGLKHLLLGSTAEKVLRHSPCPVLTVRPSETSERGARTGGQQ